MKQRNFSVGDVVIMLDESQHRMHWHLARVTKVYPDRNGEVRFVDLKTAITDRIQRPVTKIVLLEAAE